MIPPIWFLLVDGPVVSSLHYGKRDVCMCVRMSVCARACVCVLGTYLAYPTLGGLVLTPRHAGLNVCI